MEDEGPNFVPGKLYVGFVPPTMKIGQLQDHFTRYGEITESVIMNVDVTQKRYGYAFVNFADPSSVDKAIQDNDHHVINGHKVRVEKAKLTVRPIDKEHFKTKTLYVYLIPQSVSSDALLTFFGEYGKAISCSIERDKHYGSVDFQSDKTVDDILAANGNWINFRGRFMLEISKHRFRRNLKNANRSREGGDSGAQIPHRTAAYSPAGRNTSSGLRDGNQLWQPYESHGNVYGGQGAMVPSVSIPQCIGHYYAPPATMYNLQYQYGIPSHYGYGGAMGYNIAAQAGRYGGQSVVGRAGVSSQGASGSGGSSNAMQVDNSKSLFSYQMDTKGASGSGGPSNAS